MRRWELALWLAATVVVIAVVWFWPKSSEQTAVEPVTVNSRARVAASGSPLPAPSPEDLVIEQQQFDGRIFTLQYDQENNNWQLDFFQEGAEQRLRYIEAEEQFFYFNPHDLLWDEVDPQSLSEEFRQLTDIGQIIFSETQLDFFSQIAVEQESVPCNQDGQSVCAVWRAENLENFQEVLIYVNKKTRKIDQILTLNLSDSRQTPLIADYFYRTVDIQAPPSDQTRYLNSD